MSEASPEAINAMIVSGIIGGGILTLWLVARWAAGRQVKRIDTHDVQILDHGDRLTKIEATVVKDKELNKKLTDLKSDIDRRFEKVNDNINATNKNVDETREDMRQEFKSEHKETRKENKGEIDDLKQFLTDLYGKSRKAEAK